MTSSWEAIKAERPPPAIDASAAIEADLELGRRVYDLRVGAGLSIRDLAARLGTTPLVLSRLEEGSGAEDPRVTLAGVVAAVERDL